MEDYDKYLKTIYKNRFNKNLEKRTKVWKILTSNFFQKYIKKENTVVEIAAGYCEFINQIKAKTKIAVDYNPDTKKYADKNIKVFINSSTDIKSIKDESVNVVFISNFFEHLNKEDIIKTLKEVHRILNKNGKLLILQPNIRYCYKDYWMFFDHITPLDHRSMCEVLNLEKFKIKEIRPKFLPYTMNNSKLPIFSFLIKLFLKCKLGQIILGKQMFIYATK